MNATTEEVFWQSGFEDKLLSFDAAVDLNVREALRQAFSGFFWFALAGQRDDVDSLSVQVCSNQMIDWQAHEMGIAEDIPPIPLSQVIKEAADDLLLYDFPSDPRRGIWPGEDRNALERQLVEIEEAIAYVRGIYTDAETAENRSV